MGVLREVAEMEIELVCLTPEPGRIPSLPPFLLLLHLCLSHQHLTDAKL